MEGCWSNCLLASLQGKPFSTVDLPAIENKVEKAYRVQTPKDSQTSGMKSPPLLETQSKYWLSLISSPAAAATPAWEVEEEITADWVVAKRWQLVCRVC